MFLKWYSSVFLRFTVPQDYITELTGALMGNCVEGEVLIRNFFQWCNSLVNNYSNCVQPVDY